MKDRIKIGTVMGSTIAPNEEAVLKPLQKLLKPKINFELIVNHDYTGGRIKDLDFYLGSKPPDIKQLPERIREAVVTLYTTQFYVRDESPDILFHVTKPFLYGFSATVIGELYKIPSVVRVGGGVFYWHRNQKGLKKIQSLCSDYIPAFLTFHFADRVVSIGENLINMLKKSYLSTEKATVIRQPVDTNMFHPTDNKNELRRKLNLPEDKKLVLYVGRMDKLEEIGFLPKIVKEVKKRRNDILFILVGPTTEYKNTIKSKCGSFVDIRGSIPHSEIHKYYKAADLLMHLSPTEGSVPNTILEAISCGLPVVGTPVGQMKKFIPTFNSPDGFVNFLCCVEWETVDLPSEFENSAIKEEYMKIFEEISDN